MTAAQRRKAKLREHIINQATALYHKNGGSDGGFENTTIEEIAEESDISLRTFFRYFESKTDVIYLDIKSAGEHLGTFIRSRPENESRVEAAINGRFDQVFSFIDDNANKERLIRSLTAPQFEDRLTVFRSELKASVVECLTEIGGRGEPLPKNQARLASSLIVDVVGDFLEDWAKDTSINIEKKSMETIALLPELSGLITAARTG